MPIHIQVFRGLIYRVFHTKSFSSQEQLFIYWDFPGGSDGKGCTCQVGDLPSVPGEREWLPTLVFLPGEFHGQRNPAGYSPWGQRELDMAERMSLSFIYFILQYKIQLYTKNSHIEKVLILHRSFFCSWVVSHFMVSFLYFRVI